jgi:hypothetical protein
MVGLSRTEEGTKVNLMSAIHRTVLLLIAHAVFLLLAQPAATQPVDGFYLGTLTRNDRTLHVGVTLTSEGSTLSGSCFYFGRASDGALYLKGTLATDGTFHIEETSWNFDDPPDKRTFSGTWIGRRSSKGVEGFWTDAFKKRKWAFQLVPADRAASFLDGEPTTRDTGVGPLSYRMARVPRSEHIVPVVTSFSDRRVMNEVNALVFGAAAGARCYEGSGVADEHDFEATVSFAGGGFLSIAIKEGWFCGAAYPTTDADRSIVVDMRTGHTVDLEDIIDWRADGSRLLPVLFPYELDGKRTPDEHCQDVWTLERIGQEYPARWFHLTEEGIVVRLDLPHVIAYCANEVTVPYAALAAVAKPGNPLATLVAQHAGKPMRYRIHRPMSAPKEDVFYTPAPKR